jgi:hypothetical protein
MSNNSPVRTVRKPFRAFVTNKYYENQDEYESCGQTQPHTFEQYLKANISALMTEYRLTTRK